MMSFAIDTNVLAYAEGVNGDERRASALDVLGSLRAAGALIPAQALGELFMVLVRKAGRSKPEAKRALLEWGDSFPIIDTSPDVLLSALDLSADHRLSIWDAIILASAGDARCRVLLSEDLQEGFTWRGVTVVNPFRTPRHPLLDI